MNVYKGWAICHVVISRGELRKISFSRTSENSVITKFAEFPFHALR